MSKSIYEFTNLRRIFQLYVEYVEKARKELPLLAHRRHVMYTLEEHKLAKQCNSMEIKLFKFKYNGQVDLYKIN